MKNQLLEKIKKFPDSPGVYLMKDEKGKVLYVGKAGSLKRRVSSYFQRPQDTKTESLLERIFKINYQTTDSVIEAMLLESELIKKFQPPYNIRQKDDRSFLYVAISKEDYPRVYFLRGRDIQRLKTQNHQLPTYFGPYTSASALRESLDIVRKIFPYRTCQLKIPHKTCLWYQMYKFPSPCNKELSKEEYQNIIKNLTLFLKGKKARVLQKLKKEMKELSQKEQFEKAARARNQIFALKHIQDVAVMKREEEPDLKFHRIECYDISNIGGRYATGSLVVFENGRANTDEYRKFKIKTLNQIDDFGMLREVLTRRFKHLEWPIPDLVIVDGGKGQLTIVNGVLKKYGLKINAVAIAKGPERKKTDLYFSPSSRGEFGRTTSLRVNDLEKFKQTIVQLRDEAHRFAQKYHRLLRKKGFLK